MPRLRLLGEPLLIEADGAEHRLWRPETALLAYLSLAPRTRPVRREVLAALLYPERPEAAARAALRQTLFRARRRVGAVVDADGKHVRLDPSALAVDVRELENHLDEGRTVDAVALYRGPFLEGFSLPGSAPFEHWIDGERARLGAAVEKALAALADDAEVHGEWERALEWSERRLALFPLSEAAAIGCVRLQALAGDSDDAKDTFETFRLRKQQELGLEPGEALTALAERVARSRSGPSSSTGATPPTEVAPALVGRATELEVLAAAWAEAAAGARGEAQTGAPGGTRSERREDAGAKAHRAVLLTGEPGIGKTRLAEAFAERVHLEGGVVLAGRAYEVEAGVPYAALAGILRDALGAPGLAGVDAGSLGELSRILPSLATRFPAGVTPPAGDLAGGRLRLMEAFRALLDGIAYEAPLLLLLDDLPWVDEASAACLHYAWRNLPEAPLMLVTTARPEELDPEGPGGRLRTGLLRGGGQAATELSLGPLPIHAIERLWQEEERGDEPDSRPEDRDGEVARENGPVELERRTGGNPLFLVELLRARREAPSEMGEGVAPTLRTVVEERLRRLPQAERALVRAAAVLGRRFPLPTAAAMAGLEPGEAAAAAGALRRRGLVREAGVEYDFVHDVLREVVRDSLALEERRFLHTLAFRRLLPATDLAGEPDEEVGLDAAGALARHAAEAGLADAAVRWSLTAATRAEAVYAAEEAEGYLRQALRFARNPEEERAVRIRIATLARARSRFGAAAVSYLRALEARGDGAPEERVEFRIRTLECSLRAGLVDPEEADVVLREGLLDDARDAGAATYRDALLVVALVGTLRREPEAAGRAADEALEAARGAGEAGPLIHTLLLRAQLALRCDEGDSVLPLLDEAVEAARADGVGPKLPDVRVDRGTELVRLGRWDEAVAEWERGLTEAEATGAFGAHTALLLNLADLLVRRGETARGSALLDRATELCGRFHFPHVAQRIPVNRALAAWHEGDAADAVAWARRALEPDADAALPGRPLLAATERAARALLLLGLLEGGGGPDDEDERATAVQAALQELDALSVATEEHVTWADDREIVALARARALHEMLGDRAGALGLIREAAETVSEPFGRALLQLEEGRLVRSTDPEASAGMTREAAETFRSLGARPWVDRAAATDRGGGGSERDRRSAPKGSRPRAPEKHNALPEGNPDDLP